MTQNKEEFQGKLSEIVRKVGSDRDLADEIDSLGKIYEKSLEDVERLFNSVSDALDRADEMDVTRDSRVSDALEEAHRRKRERQNTNSKKM